MVSDVRIQKDQHAFVGAFFQLLVKRRLLDKLQNLTDKGYFASNEMGFKTIQNW